MIAKTFCLILVIFFRNCGISNRYVSVGNFPIAENLYTSFVDNRVDKPRLVLKKSYATNVRLF
ncbi:hypothetical protein TUM15745_12920 [Neisseria gonorrhoeae]|nr:hypothetical protein TUM19853C_10220 [Neisseria gonorrhoeae]BCD74808.1 hypothetical protein TUM19854C_06170 [Neisseria gonorrhoeae]BCD76883.1 hypothetical protein TUM15748C_05260 [Neisseria gonorrhoeae]BCD79670.1 hypothetical protein TUM15753C_10260 [Neisseria gonorrhoeae]BCD81481.1 hypothetical protein TUM16691C_06170 [Neisseria gonorrhoeae]